MKPDKSAQLLPLSSMCQLLQPRAPTGAAIRSCVTTTYLTEAVSRGAYDVKAMERRVDVVLKSISKLPPSMRISATTALEHFTAAMAGMLLDTPDIMEGVDEEITGLWNWHAMEETEHKAVVFDVMHDALGHSAQVYTICSITMVTTTAIFWVLVAEFYIRNLKSRNLLGSVSRWKTFS
ncbi:MAG: putative metal-dependent hydrolase, partial [Pseudoalteromonas tetraodonis]